MSDEQNNGWNNPSNNASTTPAKTPDTVEAVTGQPGVNATAPTNTTDEAGKVTAEAEKQRQDDAAAQAEAARTKDSPNANTPMLDHEWSDAQKAATGEDTSKEAMKDNIAYYRGPRADAPQDESEKPTMADMIKHTLLPRMFDKEGRRVQKDHERSVKSTFSNEQFGKMLEAQRSKTESPNAGNPTADNDVGVGKTVPGNNNAGWTAGK